MEDDKDGDDEICEMDVDKDDCDEELEADDDGDGDNDGVLPPPPPIAPPVAPSLCFFMHPSLWLFSPTLPLLWDSLMSLLPP